MRLSSIFDAQLQKISCWNLPYAVQFKIRIEEDLNLFLNAQRKYLQFHSLLKLVFKISQYLFSVNCFIFPMSFTNKKIDPKKWPHWVVKFSLNIYYVHILLFYYVFIYMVVMGRWTKTHDIQMQMNMMMSKSLKRSSNKYHQNLFSELNCLWSF